MTPGLLLVLHTRSVIMYPLLTYFARANPYNYRTYLSVQQTLAYMVQYATRWKPNARRTYN
jgi:hypothetical protein